MQTDAPDDGESPDCYLSLKLFVGANNEEPSDYVVKYSGTVLVWDFEGEDYKPVGEMSLFVVDPIQADMQGHSTWDVLDSVDSALAHFCPVISRRTGRFKPSVARLANSFLGGLLLLSHLEIQPAFRGKGLGLAAIEIACRRLSVGCHVALLKAFPTQWEGRVADDPAQFSRDRSRLMAYYKGAGFRPILNDGLMARRLEY